MDIENNVLIAMAVHDTKENGRTKYTKETLQKLLPSVNLARHEVHVIDNGSCEETKEELRYWEARNLITLHTNKENVGTARAINQAWELRKGRHCIKMDNDVVIYKKDWVEDLLYAINLDPNIGIVGLKRKDCWETPTHESAHYRSELKLLGGKGKRWLVVERVNHVMGTCQLYNSKLMDKIGYLYQPRLYGFDDALAAIRCKVAGFYSAFIPHVEIDHIDTGGDDYTEWKQKHSLEDMAEYNRLKNSYINGTQSIYYDSSY